MSTGQFLKQPARAGASALVRFLEGRLQRWFKLSLVLNLFLAALAAWFAHAARLARRPPSHQSSAEKADLTHRTTDPIQLFRPIRWRDIESTEYQTYIANLRNIGCPEQTIRDIIVADVHSLYSPRFRALKQTRSAFEIWAKESARTAFTVLDAEAQQVHAEEKAVISTLLGPERNDSKSEVSSTHASLPQRSQSSGSPTTVPLVFQGVESIKLNQVQLEVINDLRRQFEEDLGLSDFDVNDPSYQQRWQQAQRANDDLFVGLLGGQFYLDYQAQALDPAVSH